MSLMSRATPRASCLSVAVAAALSLALSAHAAEPVVLPDGARATELDTVEVKGHKADLEQAAGTGTRLSLSLLQTPASLSLCDIERGGRVLLTRDEERSAVLGVPPGETAERDLSWFDSAGLADVSDDGRQLLFADRFGIYLRRTDGSPPVYLGLKEGFADDISPEGSRRTPYGASFATRSFRSGKRSSGFPTAFTPSTSTRSNRNRRSWRRSARDCGAGSGRRARSRCFSALGLRSWQRGMRGVWNRGFATSIPRSYDRNTSSSGSPRC